MPKTKDPYLVLGVPRGADTTEVKRAYRRLVLLLHPDRCAGGAGLERFRDVQHAYETLNDPAARRAYDRAIEPGAYRPPGEEVPVRTRPLDPLAFESPPEPLTYSAWRHGLRFRPEPFGSLQAERLARRVRHLFTALDEQLGGLVPEVMPHRPPSVAKDLFVEIVLTEQEARTGGTYPLEIPLHKPCRACLGSGLGSLTRHCSYCDGQGHHEERKELELVVPAGTHDGQEAEMTITPGENPVVLRVVVRVA